MLMRRLTSLTLVALFLLSSLSSFYAPPAEAASARGGSKDDFSIYSIIVRRHRCGNDEIIMLYINISMRQILYNTSFNSRV